MKIYSWNVNGIRAVAKKGFAHWWDSHQADIICLQETKASPDQLTFDLLEPNGYHSTFASAQKKGYSGVVTYSKQPPIKVEVGLGNPLFDNEGRTIISHYQNFALFNIYFPNGKASPERLAYKMDYYRFLLKFLAEFRQQQPNIIICGDVNTAHQPIDLARPKENEDISGFLPIERAWIDELLDSGFVDSFRERRPDVTDQYTWWSQRSGARKRNVGWRIDYFFVSEPLLPHVAGAAIHPEVLGSDHCPISLDLTF